MSTSIARSLGISTEDSAAVVDWARLSRRRQYRKRPTHLRLGTLAEGTCRADDWIDGLAWEFRQIRLSRRDHASVQALLRARDTADEANLRDDADLGEEYSEILQALIDVAEGYLLECTQISTSKGDGACFGVWADVEGVERAVQDGEIWQTTAGKHGTTIYETGIGTGYCTRETAPRGELVWTVNDHGNGTLSRNGREIWSVV